MCLSTLKAQRSPDIKKPEEVSILQDFLESFGTQFERGRLQGTRELELPHPTQGTLLWKCLSPHPWPQASELVA